MDLIGLGLCQAAKYAYFYLHIFFQRIVLERVPFWSDKLLSWDDWTGQDEMRKGEKDEVTRSRKDSELFLEGA